MSKVAPVQTYLFDVDVPADAGVVALARRVAALLGSGERITSALVWDLASEAFGGTRAAGAYTSRDAYDGLEGGVNLYLAERARSLQAIAPDEAIVELECLLERLPNQSARTAEQILLQQFSTPPAIAYLVWLALAPSPDDEVLEPSAGTGALAVWAAAAGSRVHTNEISVRRCDLLRALGFAPTSVDAELADDLLPTEVRPTAVAMNPPFSSTGGRVAANKTIYGARHIEHALRRLRPGGRLATVIGEGVGKVHAPVAKWWRYVTSHYRVVANVALPPRCYAKYGTTYPTHLVVVDKVAPGAAAAAPRYRQAHSLADAVRFLGELPPRADVTSAVPPRPSKGTASSPQARTSSTPKLVLVPVPAAPLADASEQEDTVSESGPFVRYVARPYPGARPHPARLVETSAMAAIESPAVTYRTALPDDVIHEGRVSDVQLERIVAAGQRHSQHLPNGERAGYFLGDGTGVGKGRSLAAIILDNFLQGRRRALWLSVSSTLAAAAAEDLAAIGARISLAELNSTPTDADLADMDGVIFATYATLVAKSKSGRRRLDQLVAWLGPEPVLVVDECHKGKNAVPGALGRPTETGLCLIELQRLLPSARVIYSSATGATELRNMAYATRLGLWGEGTPFPDGFAGFHAELSGGEVAALEMVSRDLKAIGAYHSASISFAGVRYREAIHRLTDEQRAIYNRAARAWQIVLSHFDAAIELTNASRGARSAALRRFWGDHQRFFKSLITALKIPTALAEIERALAEGKSAVVSLVSTGEARTRALVASAGASGTDLDALNFAPDAILKELVRKAYPTTVYQDETDAEGNLVKRQVLDADGNPVESAEAVRRRDSLLDELDCLVLPENPLDQLVDHFGASRVAELTGRAKRLVRTDRGVEYRKRVDGVAASRINEHEMRAFQAGAKRIAVISGAAATGISLHASREVANQSPRVHLTVELGWSADAQLQAFGRTHRANQSYPPEYVLVATELGGERRFSSTIARRLESLGAITKGQRDAAVDASLAQYNLETKYGETALARFYTALERGHTRPGLGAPRRALVDMGLIREDEEASARVTDEDRDKVARFLNRVLALDCERQNAAFEFFYELFTAAVEAAKAAGTYDGGVVDVQGTSVRLAADPAVVHTDRTTGAATTYYCIDVTEPTRPVTWAEVELVRAAIDARPDPGAAGYYLRERSGALAYAEPWRNDTDFDTGAVKRTYRLRRPTSASLTVDEAELASRFRRLAPREARPRWSSEVARTASTRVRQIHVIAGAILPVWHLLRRGTEDLLDIVRLETDDGLRIVGVRVASSRVCSVLRALGLDAAPVATAADVFRMALEGGVPVRLAGGLHVRRMRLGGEVALELAGASHTLYAELRAMGLRNETIAHVQRFFVPNDAMRGVEVLKRVLAQFPVLG